MVIWELLVSTADGKFATRISRLQARHRLAEWAEACPTRRGRRMWRVTEGVFVAAVYLPTSGSIHQPRR